MTLTYWITIDKLMSFIGYLDYLVKLYFLCGTMYNQLERLLSISPISILF